MRTWTNMARPGDPYGTGQQLFRRPCQRLAAFTAVPPNVSRPALAAVAIVYLPLQRTRPIRVTEGTAVFGFRTASITDPAEASALAEMADLDLLQARRHAAILAGLTLPAELAALRRAAPGFPGRGLEAVEKAWDKRLTAARGVAAMIDASADLAGIPDLTAACAQAGLPPSRPADLASATECDLEGAELAIGLVDRALAIALICARYLGRYEWEGTLDTRQLMACNAWDCLPGAAA